MSNTRHPPGSAEGCPISTIQDKLDAAGGRPSGFNYLRLSLALSVVLIHVPQVVGGMGFAHPFWMPWLRPAHAIVIPVFFALSGFLVASSLLRCETLISFFGLRALRIAPALSVEVFLSALILGPFFTNVPLDRYFTDPLFLRYFYNLVGHVQFVLPGVFIGNPFPGQVNAQLWTIPPELKCYILLGAMSFILAFFSRAGFLACAIAFNAAIFVFDFFQPLTGAINVPPLSLLGCFMAGVSLYLFRDKIVWDGRIFAISMGLCIALLWIPHADYLLAFPAAYVTAWLGVFNLKESRLLFGGDYSYGIYLYGFPVQQAVAASFPGAPWYAQIAIPSIVGVAAMSWWIVEKPSLQLRKMLPHIEAVLTRRLSAS
jgi:peptidoglycan/LPS O-acetylase OafA/YrhL